MRAALLFMLLGCLTFGWWQNHHANIGGAISVAKILWLNLALATFFLIPAFLWRDQRVSSNWRRIYGLFFGSFILRALIEAPMLYLWQNWRCGYGITHDLLVGVLIMVGILYQKDKSSTSARRFGFLLMAMLCCEALNAWLFSQIANPQLGTYFASAGSAFTRINQLTWIEIAILYPVTLIWVYQHSRK